MNHTSFRPIWEGGQYDGDESQRQNALRLAVELGADYVDVELKVVISSMFEIVFFLLFGIVPLVNDLYDIRYMGIPFVIMITYDSDTLINYPYSKLPIMMFKL